MATTNHLHRRHRRVLALLVLLLGIAVATAPAGATSWTALGPDGAFLYRSGLALAPSAPSTLYAGTFGGVFKSNDGGASWTAIDAGLQRSNLFEFEPVVPALAVDRADPMIVYAAVHRRGVYRTTDGGERWRRSGLNATRLGFATLMTTEPTSPGKTFVAGVGGAVPAAPLPEPEERPRMAA